MKMAKASKQDISSMTDFFQELEELIEHSQASAEVIGQATQRLWPTIASAWCRVVIGCGVLIDNCCDPDLSYLEWRPDIKALLPPQESTCDG